MADVLPLAQDLAASYPASIDDGKGDSSPFARHLARLHERVSALSDEKLRLYKTWVPLYQDWRLSPDDLTRFLDTAGKEAVQPIPDYSDSGGEVPVYVSYPDGTIGPSREALEAGRRLGLRSTPL
jgi:hypothetical protein